jgi:2-polyprenyl-6-methoxyphenol hydroxylase-like FAD-dependent oxidoreductase
MNTQCDFDVLIAGAGPTGMSAGIALHDFGFRVGLIDRHEKGLDFSRAILCNAHTLRALKPFGIADKIARAGCPFMSMAVRGPGGVILEGAVGEPEADGIRPISLPQLDTERCLQEGLAERGITVMRPLRLVSFTQNDTHVISTVEGPEGLHRLTSAYLLGADGAHSRVREGLGLDYHQTAKPLAMYSQDAVLAFDGQPDLGIWILDSGAVIAMRLGDNRVRFAATSRLSFEALGFSDLIQQTTWESEFDVFFAQVTRYGEKRVWIAGDAAHIHSPIGGRGMNMGIADGIRFAEAVRGGDFVAYAAERHAVSSGWVRKNRLFTTLISDQSVKGRNVRRLLRGGLGLLSRLQGNQAAQKVFTAMTQG